MASSRPGNCSALYTNSGNALASGPCSKTKWRIRDGPAFERRGTKGNTLEEARGWGRIRRKIQFGFYESYGVLTVVNSKRRWSIKRTSKLLAYNDSFGKRPSAEMLSMELGQDDNGLREMHVKP